MTDSQKSILRQVVTRKAAAEGVPAEQVYADILAMSHTDRAAALDDYVKDYKAAVKARKDRLDADSQACADALTDCDAMLSGV